MEKLISKIPEGPLHQKWTNYKSSVKLVNPANRKKIEIIVVGTGLSGASAASALGELGYNVKVFCYQDSPGGLILLQPRVASMLQRTIRTMVTLFTGYSMT